MLCSAFAKCGHFRLSGRPTHGEIMYRQILNALGGQYTTEEGSRAEAWAFATAMALARVKYTKERAANQMNPRLVVEMLPAREKEYGLTPGSLDTILDRQGALVAKVRLVKGARGSAVTEALFDAIGADFLCYRVTKLGEIATWPTNPFLGPCNFLKPGAPSKVVRLTESIAITGSPVSVGYESMNAGESVTIDIGDVIVVSVNNLGLAERVTVSDVGSGTFEATYAKAHDAGDVATTGHFPYWICTQGHVFVVVTPTAAVDPEKRRKVNVVMEQIMRSFVTWTIVPSTDGLTTDSMKIADATFGRVGYAGLGSVAFP